MTSAASDPLMPFLSQPDIETSLTKGELKKRTRLQNRNKNPETQTGKGNNH